MQKSQFRCLVQGARNYASGAKEVFFEFAMNFRNIVKCCVCDCVWMLTTKFRGILEILCL